MKRIMTFIIMLVVIFAFSLIGVNADNNTTNINGAYYKVEETLEDINLDYGLSLQENFLRLVIIYGTP